MEGTKRDTEGMWGTQRGPWGGDSQWYKRGMMMRGLEGGKRGGQGGDVGVMEGTKGDMEGMWWMWGEDSGGTNGG